MPRAEGSAVTARPVPISAVIITRDAAETLPATLRSLSWLPEVVVYDNGSSDATCEVAAQFPNVRLVRGQFSGFGPTKNVAAGCASNDWVLSIDSDEAVTPQLRASLLAAHLADGGTVYTVRRRNFMLGRPVRHSGWGNDWLPRLYDRRVTGYNDAVVHERVLVPAGGRAVPLGGELDHDAVRRLGDFLVKIDRYTESRRGRPAPLRSVTLIALRSFWAFFRTWIIRAGVLDGWRGFVIACCEGAGVFFKYMKPYADEQQAREGRRPGGVP
jgi:glycosyltransferase involved in cell wall biosynthesis